MASTNPFLTLYSTIQMNAVGSTITTGYIPYVSTAGRQTYSNTLSTLTVSTLTSVSSITTNLNCSSIITSTITANTIIATTPSYGTNSTQVATTAFVQNAGCGNPNQAYVNYTGTGSRSNGGLNTNSTSAPITVIVMGSDAPGQGLAMSAVVGGISLAPSSYTGVSAQPGYVVPFTFVVPVGMSYRVYWNAGASFLGWFELR